MNVRPRFILGLLFASIALVCIVILFDYPMGRNKIADLYWGDQAETDHSVRRAISIDERTWSRAETVTNQAMILGLLGLVGTGAAIYYAGRTSTPGGGQTQMTRIKGELPARVRDDGSD